MNKGILFIVLFVAVAIVISGCDVQNIQKSMPGSSLDGGGSGGTIGIECYSDEDCGTSTARDYCEEDSACTVVTYNVCKDPGTYQSFCVSGGYSDCVDCPNGCDEGSCVIIPGESCLSNCEIVTEIFDVMPNIGTHVEDVSCPTGKIPITTSLVLGAFDQPFPETYCTEVNTGHGIYEAYSNHYGLAYVQMSGCSFNNTVEYQLSATCCKN